MRIENKKSEKKHASNLFFHITIDVSWRNLKSQVKLKLNFAVYFSLTDWTNSIKKWPTAKHMVEFLALIDYSHSTRAIHTIIIKHSIQKQKLEPIFYFTSTVLFCIDSKRCDWYRLRDLYTNFWVWLKPGPDQTFSKTRIGPNKPKYRTGPGRTLNFTKTRTGPKYEINFFL
jgi:hypothetical protein